MNGLRSHIKNAKECFIRYPNTSKSVKKTRLRLVFSTHFSVFGYPDETLFLVFDILHSNLKNFSLFSFEIFRLIHYYNQILGVSLEPCRRSICLLYQISFTFTAILRRFTITLFVYHQNNVYISLLVITLLK